MLAHGSNRRDPWTQPCPQPKLYILAILACREVFKVYVRVLESETSRLDSL